MHHLAAEGDFTFARLTRLDRFYRMQVLRGAFVRFDDETNEDLMRQSTYAWPHAFAKMDAEAEDPLPLRLQPHPRHPRRPRRGAARGMRYGHGLRRFRWSGVSELLLGIDIGTSSTKGVLARPEGEVVATAERPHELSLPRPGWAEHATRRCGGMTSSPSAGSC